MIRNGVTDVISKTARNARRRRRALPLMLAVGAMLAGVLLLAQPATAPVSASVVESAEAGMPGISDPSAVAGRGKVYWTELGRIRRANLDGSGAEVLVEQGLVEPGSIALDLAAGKMYWTDNGDGAQKIQRANLDGTGAKTLLTSDDGLQDPVGIALDAAAGKMYWMDRSRKVIQRANLDGTQLKPVINLGSDSHPYQLALDVTAGKMYWNDREGHRIQRANLNGEQIEDVITSRKLGASGPMGGPMGIALDAAAGRIYWVERTEGKIRSAKLDGSDAQELVSAGVHTLSGIALDKTMGKVYFTHHPTEGASEHAIWQVNVSSGGIDRVLTTGEGTRPEGIAVVPLLGNVSNFTATSGANASEVILRWTPGANATAHEVYYQVAGASWEHWSSTLAGDASGTTVTDLAAGTRYWFAVRALRGEAGSEWVLASATTAATGQGQRLGDVTNFTATPGSNAGEVVLRWTPGANATAHEVYYQVAGASWVHWSSTLAGDASGTTVTGLTAGTRYWFAVRALRGEVGSEWVLASATTSQGQRLGNAYGLDAEPGHNAGEVILRWTPGANADVHVVAYKADNANEWTLWPNLSWSEEKWDSRLTGDARSVTITGLEPGQRYSFSVVAGQGEPGDLMWSSWYRVTHATAGVPEWSPDRDALVALYEATNGPGWKWREDIPINKRWPINDPYSPISSWHGVTTEKVGSDIRVTELRLNELGLTGKPLGSPLSELVGLTELTHLDLSGNRGVGIFAKGGLTGKFPLALARNPKLTHINLAHNLFENNLDELLSAFSEREPESEFYLNISHNTWATSEASKSLAGWDGSMVVAEDEFTDTELNALRVFYDETEGNINRMKQSKDIVNNVLKKKGGSAVFGIAKLYCGGNTDCAALSDEVDKIKGLYSKAKNATNTASVTIRVAVLYYDVTILSNPLVEDLMISFVLGWINGWDRNQIMNNYLGKFPHYNVDLWESFGVGYSSACEVDTPVHQEWCDICRPFYVDDVKVFSGLGERMPSSLTACLCSIPGYGGTHKFPYVCPQR